MATSSWGSVAGKGRSPSRRWGTQPRWLLYLVYAAAALVIVNGVLVT